MNQSKLHNPVYIGPGTWYTIHTLAAEAKTNEDKRDVIKHIRTLQRKFSCSDCKGHFGEYLATHPPEETLGASQSEDSLFLWTVNFHNAVNYRLRKPQVSYEEAKSIYMNDSIFCSAKCDEEDTPVPIKKEGTSSKSSLSKGRKLVPSDITSILL
jgi:hypothetical protein